MSVTANRFRPEHRELTASERAVVSAVKDKAEELALILDGAKSETGKVDARAKALAMTKLEECVMWAVKSVTG